MELETRGGPRPGAGRKTTGRKTKSLYITESELDKVTDYLLHLRVNDETCIRSLSVKHGTEIRNIVNSITNEIVMENIPAKNEQWFWIFKGKNYFTDNQGDGIFTEDIVIAKASQMSIRGLSISGARKKLNRWYEENNKKPAQ